MCISEAADIPVCVRGRLPACFYLMDALEYLFGLFVRESDLRLEPFPLLRQITTNAVSGFSEVLVTPSDTVRPSPVQECRGKRAKVLQGLIFWRRFSLGLDLLVVFFQCIETHQ